MSPPRRPPRQLPSISNLPPSAAPFVGRDEEIEDVHQRLDNHRAVLVHDPQGREHGYGSSQLGVVYSHRYTRHYELMWVFDCGGEKDARKLAARVESQLARLYDEYELKRGQAMASPTMANWLYFYDNVDEPDAVRPYFPEGNARILVTSRRTGTWDDEARLCVGPLEREDSIRLIQEVTALDHPQAARLAEIFDGHPGQIVRIGQAIRGGSVTAEQFITLTEIARMAPAPAARREPTSLVLPRQRRAEVSDSDRTSLWTNLLASPVCRTSKSYQGWIDALRGQTGKLLDEALTTDLPIAERVDLLLDIAFEDEKPDFLLALAATVQAESDRTRTGRETAGSVRRLVDEIVGSWQAAPQTRSTTPAVNASCFFFTSWFNRDIYAEKVVRFHTRLEQEVTARLGARDMSAGFIDRNIRRGTQWEPLMIESIRTTRLLVPLITKDYFTSPWCRREWAVMMNRIASVEAAPGREPVAIMPVFWVRPGKGWRLSKEFERFQHRAPGNFQGNVYDLMVDHRGDEFTDYVSALAQAMVDESDTPLPHLAADQVMDLPLAFPDVNGGAP